MKKSSLVLLAALAVGVACTGEQPKFPQFGKVLPNLPLPPQAEVLSRSGNTDALQIVFVSALTPEQMIAFYRLVLNSGEWHLVSDTKTADGAVALYAERKGPPIWVRIRQTAGAAGSTVEVAGAVLPDSTKADTGKS